jgi:hypothetical protein
VRWQQIRGRQSGLSHALVAELVELDAATRELSREIKALRTRLHLLQQNLAPHRKKQDHGEARQKIVQQIRSIKSKIIPRCELQLNELSERLSSKLCHLGTFVDEEAILQCRYCGVTDSSSLRSSGYKASRVVVSGIDEDTAFRLQQALILYALDFVRRIKSSSFKIRYLPNDEFSISKQNAHDMIGCHQGDCCICAIMEPGDMNRNEHDTITISSSSLCCLSQLHRRTIHMQNQLPMIEACVSTTKHPTGSIWNILGLGDNHIQPSVVDTLHELSQSLELLVLYSPTESLRPMRNYQSHLVNNLINFYQTLFTKLPTSTRTPLCLRTRAVPPHLLLPCEASRVVIEGVYLTGEESSKTILLGFVSNCLDFVSRSCQVKSRLRPGERAENVCTLHLGWIVDSQTVLKWILDAEVETDVVESGSDAEDSTSNTSFSANRNVPSCGPKTKPTSSRAKKIVVPADLIPYLHSDFCGSYKEHKNIYSRFENEMIDTTRVSMPVAACEVAKTESIHLEAACNPFDFLPLGRTGDGGGNKAYWSDNLVV